MKEGETLGRWEGEIKLLSLTTSNNDICILCKVSIYLAFFTPRSKHNILISTVIYFR